MTPGSEALVSLPLRGYGDYILWMLELAEKPGRDATLGGAALRGRPPVSLLLHAAIGDAPVGIVARPGVSQFHYDSGRAP